MIWAGIRGIGRQVPPARRILLWFVRRGSVAAAERWIPHYCKFLRIEYHITVTTTSYGS
jgi:hypothetical protein